MSGFSTGTAWVIGEGTGSSVSGTTLSPTTGLSAAISLATVVGSGVAAPTAAPAGRTPVFRNTSNDDIYVWQGTTWVGPYNKGT